jgi:hypothetical protein
VEGVGHVLARDAGRAGVALEAVGERCDDIGAVGAEIICEAQGLGAAPIMVELDEAEVPADSAEAVDVAVALPPPVDELDAELDGTLGFPQEFILVEAEGAVEEADLRDGRLADADGADRVGFDELIDQPVSRKRAKAAAAIHPAVPPPTITIPLRGGGRLLVTRGGHAHCLPIGGGLPRRQFHFRSGSSHRKGTAGHSFRCRAPGAGPG